MVFRSDHADHTSRPACAIVPEELGKALFGTRLHRRMYKEFDAVVDPHPPLPFPDWRRQHE